MPKYPISQATSTNKITYCKDADVAYIHLNDEAVEVVFDFDDEGNVTGFEILNPSEFITKLRKVVEDNV